MQQYGPGDRQAWPAMTLLYFLWGSTYLGVAIVVTTMPPLLSVSSRLFVAALIIAAFVVVTKGPSALKVSALQLRNSAMMGIGLLGFGLGTVALGERYVPSGITALLIAITPLWIVIFRLLSRDRPSKLTLIGVAVGLVGVAFMVLPGGTVPVSGNNDDVLIWMIALLLGSLSWAYFSWRAKSFDLPKPLATGITYELLAGAVFLALAGLISRESVDFSTFSTASWWALLFLVAASVVGYSAYGWLLQHVRMSFVATYAYVNPIVAVFLGLLIVGEPLSSDVVVGMTIVLGGVVLVISGERRPAAITSETATSPK